MPNQHEFISMLECFKTGTIVERFFRKQCIVFENAFHGAYKTLWSRDYRKLKLSFIPAFKLDFEFWKIDGLRMQFYFLLYLEIVLILPLYLWQKRHFCAYMFVRTLFFGINKNKHLKLFYRRNKYHMIIIKYHFHINHKKLCDPCGRNWIQ